MSRRRVLHLSEIQVLVGRMHRASLTMPAGSKVFLGELLAMMRGLKLPWHRRRLTAAGRRDILALIRILQSNHGRGYFDISHLPWADPVWSDAMKDGTRAGWGWCTLSGQWDGGV